MDYRILLEKRLNHFSIAVPQLCRVAITWQPIHSQLFLALGLRSCILLEVLGVKGHVHI